MRSRTVLGLFMVLALVAAACGDDDGDDAASGDGAASCEIADLPLAEAGVLTVATGEPAFPPWVDDDAPESGEGFEAAVVYAVADEMGFESASVTWVRTGFDEAIAPGDKDYDFNIQQYSINADRDEVVDFSDPYYVAEQAIVASEASDITAATSLDDLKSAKLGAAVGSTSLDYIDLVIEPDEPASAFDDNVGAKSALEAGQVDGLVFDLPTAYFITAVEIPEASIVGVLPREGDTGDELGMLFAEGSGLVGCVNEALAELHSNGTIEDLEDQYLNEGGNIPTLSG